MSYAIGDVEFEGPFQDLDEILDQRGVFIVVNNVYGDRTLLDVGWGEQMRSEIRRNPKMFEWKNRCYSGSLEFGAAYYVSLSDAELDELAARLRAEGQAVFGSV